MNIAKIIVDVPANQIDRTFDYLIPEDWHDEDFIQPGMRVIVPFGPRKVQGFVVGLSNETEIKKLKSVESVLDLTPVLTQELLELGEWLRDTTLCFLITAYQAMLPAAMKVKYEKEVHLKNAQTICDELKNLFVNDVIQWKEIENNKLIFPLIQKELKKGNMEVVYRIEDRAKKKKVKVISTKKTKDELLQLLDSFPNQALKQKEIIQFFIDGPEQIELQQLINILDTTISPINSLIKKGILQEHYEEVYRDPYEKREFKQSEPLPLTEEQTKAMMPIIESIRKGRHDVFLMYGVTGSGKTEIYLQAIAEVLKQGKEAIMLVPEISLTPMMVARFKSRFGADVAVLHSGLSQGEKYDEWRKIQRKEVKVVVGARSAIFAPFENLGIIIIDEEHETSYKQEENPRYHARDVAIKRGKYHQCPVVLGSATPSLESFARAQKGVYRLLTLKKRINASVLPAVEIVDMREELRCGNRSMFSKILFEKLKDRLEKGEQSVLFLNRRGFSTFVMCRDCGFVLRCPHCDISLTYHKHDDMLKCHYCSFETRLLTTCPECRSEHIRFFGTGTQKVEEELAKLLPEARVIRMDVDTTSRKGAHEKLLSAFEEKKADILLGTQMIAKGLDFPDVTFVGVLAADSMLHIPDFRASEKTFQLITQVSGRAGRHELPGEVVIQTYTPDHYSIVLAAKTDYDTYYRKEMAIRKLYHYPPFYFLTLITISHPELMKVVDAAEKVSAILRGRLSNQAIILGPVASPIPRLKNRYRYQCMIKYKDEPNLGRTLRSILHHFQQEMSRNDLQISIDMNPFMMI
ncbi:primosomal protein N' [Calidifontibacillus erzurumensis]|uniref:Replication restart protein PriA n=1 Tax=Calidifontibacillus erzurumensis TaxID=2741433 RepID=A0A8J8KBN7_9BACI|nr:primosomal protein N' [Calidifontibacillus erzurumensis]NSL51233.1 primosomal protein N' [Calidifontibacillus erzurumensis]